MDRAAWWARAAGVPVARLATRAAVGDAVDLVPVTFVLVGDRFVSAVDHKPKTTRSLARLANVRAHGTATALVDHWDDDWTRLWWVRLRGRAEVVEVDDPMVHDAIDALVDKYPPYRIARPAGPCVVVHVDDVRGWAADG